MTSRYDALVGMKKVKLTLNDCELWDACACLSTIHLLRYNVYFLLNCEMKIQYSIVIPNVHRKVIRFGRYVDGGKLMAES